jgi:hypothetical protein
VVGNDQGNNEETKVMPTDFTWTWRDASTNNPPCDGWYVVYYRSDGPPSDLTAVLRRSGQSWIDASHIVTHFAGPFATPADATWWKVAGTVPNSSTYSPYKHKLALMALKELAGLCGNPGRTANRLLEIVGELLEIK